MRINTSKRGAVDPKVFALRVSAKGLGLAIGPWPFESLAKVRLSFDVSFTISWVSWPMSL